MDPNIDPSLQDARNPQRPNPSEDDNSLGHPPFDYQPPSAPSAASLYPPAAASSTVGDLIDPRLSARGLERRFTRPSDCQPPPSALPNPNVRAPAPSLSPGPTHPPSLPQRPPSNRQMPPPALGVEATLLRDRGHARCRPDRPDRSPQHHAQLQQNNAAASAAFVSLGGPASATAVATTREWDSQGLHPSARSSAGHPPASTEALAVPPGDCGTSAIRGLSPLVAASSTVGDRFSSRLASEGLGARFTPPPGRQPPSALPNFITAPSIPPLAPVSSTAGGSPSLASHLTLKQLKAQCRAHGLPVGGTKAQLVERLNSLNANAGPPRGLQDPLHTQSPQALCQHAGPSSTPAGLDSEDVATGEEDLTSVLQDTAFLEASYQRAIDGEPDSGNGDEDEEGEDEGGEDGEDRQDDKGGMGHVNTTTADDDGDDMGWVNKFILNTRRAGGRQTELSVLKAYEAWLPSALRKGTVPDRIIDANHMIHYLKYAATRCLFTTQGRKKETDERLSAQLLKKIVTMLGRIRNRQQDSNPTLLQNRPARNSRSRDYIKSVMVEARRLRIQRANFDVTRGTLLEYELRPEQFVEVTAAIFNMDQVPSIIKSLFSWNWQAATLNRGDELVNLSLAFLQPYV